jgi:predicted MFS family arabinose efflux permease
MGFAASLSMPAATQAIHRVLPFKDHARGIGLLYMGNFAGSAMCPPLAVWLESLLGWRGTFLSVAIIGMVWVPIWIVVAYTGRNRARLTASNTLSSSAERAGQIKMRKLAQMPGVLRGSLLVAAAAPVTLVMLIWAAKYLVRDHGVPQRQLGMYLWLPALLSGVGALLFGEMRARSARSRSRARPPRRLVALAMLLCALIALVPVARGPQLCILIASTAMLGAGGLYTLATSDMLAHTPRQAAAATTAFTTVTQSLIYVIASPIIGWSVEHFGNFNWIMIGAGIWVLPCSMCWLADTFVHRERILGTV